MKKLLLLLLLLPLIGSAQIINTVAGNGVRGFSGDGGPAISAELFGPEGVAVSSSGVLYIADFQNNCIRMVNSAGIITTVAGNTSTGYSGDGGAATAAELDGPSGLTLDDAGNLYIADLYNNVIRKVDTMGVITTVAGNGYAYGTYTGAYSGDGGPATNAEMSGPGMVAYQNGSLYISDEGNNRVRVVSPAGIISTFAGKGIAGYSGDNGPADSAEFNNPVGLAFDDTGNLYIADEFNNRIRKVSVAGVVTTIAGNGYNSGSSTGGFSGDGGPADSAELFNPVGVGVDSSGDVLITDYDNNRVRKISRSGVITTIAGDSVQGFSGDGGPAIDAELFSPTAITVQRNGYIYIADAGNSRVRIITKNGIVIDTGTSINNLQVKGALSIFPNPSTTTLTIQSTSVPVTGISITNVLGQVVSSKQFTGGGLQVDVDVSGLALGVYFVRVNGSAVKKFLKE